VLVLRETNVDPVVLADNSFERSLTIDLQRDVPQYLTLLFLIWMRHEILHVIFDSLLVLKFEVLLGHC
jgi:hypothetical protein